MEGQVFSEITDMIFVLTLTCTDCLLLRHSNYTRLLSIKVIRQRRFVGGYNEYQVTTATAFSSDN